MPERPARGGQPDELAQHVGGVLGQHAELVDDHEQARDGLGGRRRVLVGGEVAGPRGGEQPLAAAHLGPQRVQHAGGRTAVEVGEQAHAVGQGREVVEGGASLVVDEQQRQPVRRLAWRPGRGARCGAAPTSRHPWSPPRGRAGPAVTRSTPTGPVRPDAQRDGEAGPTAPTTAGPPRPDAGRAGRPAGRPVGRAPSRSGGASRSGASARASRQAHRAPTVSRSTAAEAPSAGAGQPRLDPVRAGPAPPPRCRTRGRVDGLPGHDEHVHPERLGARTAAGGLRRPGRPSGSSTTTRTAGSAPGRGGRRGPAGTAVPAAGRAGVDEPLRPVQAGRAPRAPVRQAGATSAVLSTWGRSRASATPSSAPAPTTGTTVRDVGGSSATS